MKALLIVDLQNDFLPGGALAVPKGDEIIPFVNEIQQQFSCVVASKDWHLEGHMSFATWPAHCIQESYGAEFPRELDTSRIEKVFYKGIDLDVDSYSAFFDNEQKRSTGLIDYLVERNVGELYVVGLATDYCVQASVLDALRLGLKTYVLAPGCRGIGDEKSALSLMEEKGAVVASGLTQAAEEAGE